MSAKLLYLDARRHHPSSSRGSVHNLEDYKMYGQSVYKDTARVRQSFAHYAYAQAMYCDEVHEKKVLQRRAREEWLAAVGAREMGL